MTSDSMAAAFVMARLLVLPLLLCACVARTADDVGGSDETIAGEETQDGETTSGQTTTPMTSVGPLDDSVGSATVVTTIDTIDPATGEPTTPTLAEDVQPIFDEHCLLGCHEPDGEWGFLLDLSGNAYAAVVGVPAPQFPAMSLIEPGEPEKSYLWHKLSGTQASIGGSGLAMPKARSGQEATVLTSEQLDTIEQWIIQGAEP